MPLTVLEKSNVNQTRSWLYSCNYIKREQKINARQIPNMAFNFDFQVFFHSLFFNFNCKDGSVKFGLSKSQNQEEDFFKLCVLLKKSELKVKVLHLYCEYLLTWVLKSDFKPNTKLHVTFKAVNAASITYQTGVKRASLNYANATFSQVFFAKNDLFTPAVECVQRNVYSVTYHVF